MVVADDWREAEGGPGRGAGLDGILGDEQLKSAVATVDNLDTPDGPLTTVLVLGDRRAGRDRSLRVRDRRRPGDARMVEGVTDPASRTRGATVGAKHGEPPLGWARRRPRRAAVGFVRVLVVAAILGTTYLGNAYQSSNSVSNVLFELVAAGALSAVLVPTFVGAARPRRRRAAWSASPAGCWGSPCCSSA